MSVSDITNIVRETVSDAARAVHSRATTAYLTIPVALSTLLVPGTAEAHPSNEFIHIHARDVVEGARIPLAMVAVVFVAGALREGVREITEYRQMTAQGIEETAYDSLKEARNRAVGGAASYTLLAGAVAMWAAPVVRDLVNQYL